MVDSVRADEVRFSLVYDHDFGQVLKYIIQACMLQNKSIVSLLGTLFQANVTQT